VIIKKSLPFENRYWDPAKEASFPGGILAGKNSHRASRQEPHREICPRRDPFKKKISSRIQARILPGSKILVLFPARTKFSTRKSSCIEILAEN